MNENRVKAIINECVGFERKHITDIKSEENIFGGLAKVTFRVKGEKYILIPNSSGFHFDFLYEDENEDENKEEPTDLKAEAPTDTEATEAEAPTEA